MIFGYARVSTHEQNLDRQLEELNKIGVDEVFQEKVL
ncbi:MAG: recombinase family protein [Candidatus Cloacimonadales bacterium]|jgi:DNA invertase Pin-like site-specific DNA recombinase|nr:recombinase family protein [Candidatus Cloacimonadales bacterium]